MKQLATTLAAREILPYLGLVKYCILPSIMEYNIDTAMH